MVADKGTIAPRVCYGDEKMLPEGIGGGRVEILGILFEKGGEGPLAGLIRHKNMGGPPEQNETRRVFFG
ncbi:hypothetical protein CEXT_81001 [Caerostris extrusa]|uniref:Uncharacterized protein n=1 Tax=Caerostris extrusa TaxID=172846 RepID=A0AAV4M4J4_CAEEX|nr:hypothetical protein CEXT_81001 [Caerostris extrusa]